MKKTLIALIALAGVAAATETSTTPITLTATFTSSIAATYPADASYAVAIQSLSVANKTGGSYMTEYLRPDLNMNTGRNWTLSFTLTNNGNEVITLNSVIFDSFIFNGSGEQHNDDDVSRQARFTLTDSSSTVLGTNDVTFTSSSDYNTDADSTITFASSLKVAAGESIQLNLTVGRDSLSNLGAFVGLKGATFSGEVTVPEVPNTPAVPEPATATLSLLALAGLAARRRRK